MATILHVGRFEDDHLFRAKLQRRNEIGQVLPGCNAHVKLRSSHVTPCFFPLPTGHANTGEAVAGLDVPALLCMM